MSAQVVALRKSSNRTSTFRGNVQLNDIEPEMEEQEEEHEFEDLPSLDDRRRKVSIQLRRISSCKPVNRKMSNAYSQNIAELIKNDDDELPFVERSQGRIALRESDHVFYHRVCTDKIGILALCMFLFIWIASGCKELVTKEWSKVLQPIDMLNKTCRVDENLLPFNYSTFIQPFDYKYIFHNARQSLLNKCVKNCPSDHFAMQTNLGENCTNLKDFECTTNEYSCTHNLEKCAQIYYPSRPIFQRCIPYIANLTIPMVIDFALENFEIAKYLIGLVSPSYAKMNISIDDAATVQLHTFLSVFNAVIFMFVIILCLMLSYGVMISTKYLGNFASCVTLVAFVGCGLLGYSCIFGDSYYKLPEGISYSRSTLIGITAAVMLTLMAVGIILFKKSCVAVTLLEESGEVLHAVFKVMNMRAIFGIAQIFAILFTLLVQLYINRNSEDGLIMHRLNYVGYLWAKFFIPTVSFMVVSTIFANYYWTFHKSTFMTDPVSRCTLLTFRYSLGSASVHCMIMILLNWILSHNYNDYPVTSFGIIQGVQFISQICLIICIIRGDSILTSPKYLLKIILKNPVHISLVTFISIVLCLLIQAIVIAICMLVTYYKSNLMHEPNYYQMFSTAAMGGTAFYVSSFFLEVYFIGVATIIMCYFTDLDLNNGSTKAPYYMTKKLMKSAGHKNVADHDRFYFESDMYKVNL